MKLNGQRQYLGSTGNFGRLQEVFAVRQKAGESGRGARPGRGGWTGFGTSVICLISIVWPIFVLLCSLVLR